MLQRRGAAPLDGLQQHRLGSTCIRGSALCIHENNNHLRDVVLEVEFDVPYILVPVRRCYPLVLS